MKLKFLFKNVIYCIALLCVLARPSVGDEPAVPEETSGGRTAVDMDAPTDWSDGGADETTGWVGMHGWYY